MPHPDALDHEVELRRLRRLDALAELLPAFAGALDLRQVFHRVAEVTRRVLPHDLMAVVLLEEDLQYGRLYAVSGDVDFERPERVRLQPEDERLLQPGGYDVIDDISGSRLWEERPPGRLGLRSLLRVPLPSAGAPVGGLAMFARAPGTFTREDVPILQRVGAFVALALSHQRLAEEAARAAEARERALQLERRVESLTSQLASLSVSEHRIVGRAPAWLQVIAEATRVARTETTVLLTGESGTGKELVARLIHRESPRARGPFVAINCAALPETLLESELFGAERGAYTGATQPRPGRLEMAAGGTLFLDEVAEMSPALQAKLLRVIQEREFQRLGGGRPLKADVRVIGATNRDLGREVAQGRFREDLFYRLNVFGIRLPALRERREDILPLAGVFLDDVGRQLGRPAPGLSAEARPALLRYSWPGNVRELRNVLERAAILADGGLVTGAHLMPPSGADPAAGPEPIAPAPHAVPEEARAGGPQATGTLADVEREMLARALVECRYNKTAVARRLGITRAQLYVRLRRHGLE